VCQTNLVKAEYAETYVLKELDRIVNTPFVLNSIMTNLKKSSRFTVTYDTVFRVTLKYSFRLRVLQ
jgi:hypothetical protein